jgi:hypothetical protein
MLICKQFKLSLFTPSSDNPPDFPLALDAPLRLTPFIVRAIFPGLYTGAD